MFDREASFKMLTICIRSTDVSEMGLNEGQSEALPELLRFCENELGMPPLHGSAPASVVVEEGRACSLAALDSPKSDFTDPSLPSDRPGLHATCDSLLGSEDVPNQGIR
jgi:hypothetical protein